MAEQQLPFDLATAQAAIDRKRQLAQIMLQQAMQGQQGQMVSGHYVAPSLLATLAPLAMGAMAKGVGEQADTAAGELAAKYKSDLAAGLQKYFTTREGKPGQTMTTEQADALMNGDQAPQLAGPVKADPRRAMIEAMTSQIPELRLLGQMELASTFKQDASPETFGHSPVTEKDATGKLISVLYGNRGTRRVVGEATPYEKPMVVADRLVDPANPTQPVADYETKGGQVVTDDRGDKYQIMSNGTWKKLDNAPKITVSQSTTTVNKGEDEFSKALGKDVAEEFKKVRSEAQQAYKTKSVVSQLQELEKQGIFSGPTANVATTLAAVGNTLGLPVDQAKLANSQAFQQQFAQQVANVLTAGSGVGRSMTDEDRKAFERSLPTILMSPQGRRQVYKMLNAASEAAISRHRSFQEQLRNNPTYKDAAGMLTLNPVDMEPQAGVAPPGNPAVPGATAPRQPMPLDAYLKSKGMR